MLAGSVPSHPMESGDLVHDAPLPAGDFTAWLREMQGALRDERDSEVPCDGCTACCTSSQFVQIGADETETLARIPPALLFPAPRMPAGHRLLGYDERGHCPMLVGGRCSIYEHRPRTCRTYDCRVFALSGVEADDEDDRKALIGLRARRWRFESSTATARAERDAVRAAAAFLADHPALPEALRPVTAAQRAVLAILVHGAFLDHDGPGGPPHLVDPDPVQVVALVRTALSTGQQGPARGSEASPGGRPGRGGARRRGAWRGPGGWR